MQFVSDPEVKKAFNAYPKQVKTQLLYLRALILETANELNNLNILEETFKWGEPSYVTKHGSTIRIDWKAKNPNQYAMYFQCSTSLVPTFKIIYKNIFEFEGSRAIVFQQKTEIPKAKLKHCITLALTYHKIKHLPLLGA
ncbi:DUF1801 domain-containing protein [Mariniflexile sp. AS56]|uniref:DUF1801 domain-containing protein n=1 Tax=Mariniflexile sp. AS56 TaxID=3063957 RepID=UPI0026EFB0EE|nr:DUF1801 domain-containing protein [Mariniflexile sp. AS56]MDO7174159.1 DUF1801 domain-containing protein [Mariniflexile sp. AS56]